MEFRPCIDIHNGKVKQIVGGSLKDEKDFAKENFVSEMQAADYAALYREKGLRGGHIILLNAADSPYYEADLMQAKGALLAWQGALLALNDLPAVTRETIARYLILQHTSLERQQKLFYCRESFLKQEYKLRLTPTELLELSLSLLASGKLEGDSKSVTQIGTVRFLADCLGLDFPANYDSLMYQLKEREQLTKFMDELRQSLIAYLRKKNG